MTPPKTERNKLVVKLIDKGWTYSQVMKEVGLKSKGTVLEIYQREKHGVRRYIKKSDTVDK